MAVFFLIMIIMALFQGYIMIKQKQWGEFIAFAVLWIIATTYGVLVIMNVPIPRPGEVIVSLFENLPNRLRLR
jgi:hypothetical protein